MTSYLAGLSLGLSLILPIGAQNAFVLKQGLKKQHVFLVCLICATSDAILIGLGIGGFSQVISRYPSIEQIARYAGALFLTVYALQNFISAVKNSHSLQPGSESPAKVWTIITLCLALTWLNPHVYLDTVVLLGAISTQYENSVWQFGMGAVSASFLFFFSLGYGARWLTPLFQQPVAWKILEFMIAVVMLSIAVSLIIA